MQSLRAVCDWQSLMDSGDRASPESYIASLRSQLPTPEPISEQTRSALEKIGVTEDSDPNEDYAVKCVSVLRSRLSDRVLKYIEDSRLLFAEVNAAFPAAQMVRCHDGRCAVILTSGLHKLCYRIIRALCTRVQAGDAIFERDDFAKTAQIIADICFWYKNAYESHGPQYTIPPRQMFLASDLTAEAMMFCVAHEIAHATFRIDPDLNHVAVGGRDEEFDADGTACFVTLSRPPEQQDAAEFQRSYAGAELFLRVYQILERYGLAFSYDEHPNFDERLERLRLVAKMRCNWDEEQFLGLTDIARAFEALTDVVVESFSTLRKDESVLRAAEAHIKALNELLEACTGAAVPNYLGFYASAKALLDQPYSESFVELLRSKATEFVRTCASAGIATNEKQKLSAFQKYKLLLGLFSNLREPAASVFMSALEESSFRATASEALDAT